MQVTRTDPFTQKENTLEIDITQEQITAWCNGTHIQNAMPDLTPDEREFIMTGIMADSWEKMFPVVVGVDSEDKFPK